MNIAARTELREKMLKSVYSYRNTNIIFKFKLWPEMQQSDENLKLIYQYVIDKSKIVNDKLLLAQWQKLKEHTPSLHEAALKDEISLNNNGILVIKRFNA